MRRFNKICDSHFPNGYEDWIQDSIENTVNMVVNEIKERINIDNLIIFDIGSLNGIESVKFTEKLPNCKVYNFEPNPFSYQTVLKSCENIENISKYNLAIGDYNGKSDFYIMHHNMGGSSILSPTILDKLGNYCTPYTVDISRLDTWCENNKINKIDFIWMDVQGAELKILSGAGDLLKNVSAIYTESSLIPYYDGAPHKDEVIEFLNKQGFELVYEKLHDEYEGDFLFFKV